MDHVPKPSIMRLARRAGVKSLAEDCYPALREIIEERLNEVLELALIVNSERATKTLMVEDITDALHFLGHNVSHSADLTTTTCAK